MGSEVGAAPKNISEEVGMAVLVDSEEYFLAGLEMTQTILTTSTLEQEGLKGSEIYLSSREMSAGRVGLICRRKEVSGWFVRRICLPAWCSSCCKSVLKTLWLMKLFIQ